MRGWKRSGSARRGWRATRRGRHEWMRSGASGRGWRNGVAEGVRRGWGAPRPGRHECKRTGAPDANGGTASRRGCGAEGPSGRSREGGGRRRRRAESIQMGMDRAESSGPTCQRVQRDPCVRTELTDVVTAAAQAAREGKTEDNIELEGTTEDSQEVRVGMRSGA